MPERHRETVGVRGVVDVAGRAAGRDPHRRGAGSTRRRAWRQVDHQPVVDAAEPGAVVAAAADRDPQACSRAQADRGDDVGRVDALRR